MADPNKPASAKPTPELAPIKLLYDTWNENEERIPAGTVVKVPTEIARQLISAGKAERADPLPGEPA